MKITVTTAEKLSKEQIKNISSAFAKAQIQEVIDESLIAGIQIKVGSQLYDGSVKAKLAEIKSQLGKLF